jgi:hypothetical protein
MTNKVVKSVSFNHSVLDDQTILSHIENKNFSGYVKQLILQDIEKLKQPLRITKTTTNGGIKIVLK